MNEDLGSKNGVRFDVLGQTFKVSGEGIGLNILGSRSIGKVKVEGTQGSCDQSTLEMVPEPPPAIVATPLVRA